jgi:hypothetical protein
MDVEDTLLNMGYDPKTIVYRFDFNPHSIPDIISMNRTDVLRWCIARLDPAMESTKFKFYRGSNLHVACSPEGEVLGIFENLKPAFDYLAPLIFQSSRLLVEQPDKLSVRYVLATIPELDRVSEKVYPLMVNDFYLLLKDDGFVELDEEVDAAQIAALFDEPIRVQPREILYEEKGKDVICEPVFQEANLQIGYLLMTHAWIAKVTGKPSPSRDELLVRAGVMISVQPLLWKDKKVNHRVFYCAPSSVAEVMHQIELNALRALMSAKVLMVSKGCNLGEVEAISTLAELKRHPLRVGF